MVTVLSLAGALGFGPGAALGKPGERIGQLQNSRTDAGTAAADDTASSTLDGWLTVKEPDPQTDVPRTDPPDPTTLRLPARTGSGKRVVYSEQRQRVWLVDRRDKIVRTYLVSGGTDEDLLDPGRYEVYSKSRHAISFNHKSTMDFMVRFASGESSAIGFHDIPEHLNGATAQSRSELGTPLSSGCIRQWVADARALWDFTPVGTTVVVAD